MVVGEPNASAADTWSGQLTEAVVRCGRDSERKLYLYGISSNRCAKCRARLQPDNSTCVKCNYKHKTPRECTRCSQKNNPVMWCAVCDAYYCAICHKKPHVLGSTKPHQCFPIDGASGKHFVEAAWSEEFTAMTQANYRVRLHDKKQADQAAAKEPTQATDQVAAPAVKEAGESTAITTNLLKQPQEGSSATAAVDGAAGVSSASTSAAPPSSGSKPNAQELLQKRQLLDSDDTRDRLQKRIRGDDSLHSDGRAAATPAPTQAPALADGMTLYDRVKEMHDRRARAAQARSPKTGFNRLMSQREEHQRKQGELEKRGPDNVQQREQYQRKQGEQDEQEKRGPDDVQQQQLEQHQQQDQEQAEQFRMEQLRLERLRTQKQLEEERLQKKQEKQRFQAECRQQEEQRWQANQMQQEKRKQDILRQQEQLQERQRQQQLMGERMRHEQILHQQDEARSLMHEGSRFLSHAQYVLHAQPAYTSMASSSMSVPMPSMPATSMAPLSISALMPSSARFMQAPSPVNVSPHTPRFESAIPFPQNYPLPSNPGASAMGNDLVYQKHAAALVSRFETLSQNHEGICHPVVRDPNVQQEQQTTFPDAMVPHSTATGTGADLTPSKSGEDDELRAIWVNDYDNVNALVMQLDMEITKRTEEGHSFVHMSNNITIPEQLKLQLNNLRAQRDTATKKRFKSLARVLIFSNEVRSFAQQNEHSNIWSDVPEVLKSSHKKCAELAANIRVSEGQARTLREKIDEAVSSGDPLQMQNVARLGALIADLERKIRTSNAERDKQFMFMFQFSTTLRNTVRAEWATTGRGYHMQSNQ